MLGQAYLEQRMARDLRIYLGRLGFPHERHSDEALMAMLQRTFTRVSQPPTYLKEEHDRGTTTGRHEPGDG